MLSMLLPRGGAMAGAGINIVCTCVYSDRKVKLWDCSLFVSRQGGEGRVDDTDMG